MSLSVRINWRPPNDIVELIQVNLYKESLYWLTTCLQIKFHCKSNNENWRYDLTLWQRVIDLSKLNVNKSWIPSKQFTFHRNNQSCRGICIKNVSVWLCAWAWHAQRNVRGGTHQPKDDIIATTAVLCLDSIYVSQNAQLVYFNSLILTR